MIRIITGGKKHLPWAASAIAEYEKRLKKPFDIRWEIVDEAKLDRLLADWKFRPDEFVIITDERGTNISSPEFSKKCETAFNSSKSVVIVIGGAYGVSEEARHRADFLWSFSRLVFPHQLARVIVAEQIYRAQEISHGGQYHHE